MISATIRAKSFETSSFLRWHLVDCGFDLGFKWFLSIKKAQPVWLGIGDVELCYWVWKLLRQADIH